MKRLKLTGRLHQGYSGLIGRYPFVDGISVELIPENERIRIAANFSVVEIDEEGSEGKNPSPSHAVVSNHRTRIALTALPRQTEEEKNEENVRAVMGSEKIKPLISAEKIEEIASEKGIAGLREIAVVWGVKSKSIPVLMQMIIDAQKDYVAGQREKLKSRGVPDEEIEKLLTLGQEIKLPEAKVVEAPAVSVADAAATGDLAAAISAAE